MNDIQERRSYETEANLADETAMVRYVAPIWGCEFEKLDELAVADFAVHRTGKPVGIVEFKRRNCYSETFRSLMIGTRKIRTCLAYAGVLPFVLVVRWKDGYYWHQVHDPPDYRKRRQGRTRQKRDECDEEWCFFIPVLLFRKIQ